MNGNNKSLAHKIFPTFEEFESLSQYYADLIHSDPNEFLSYVNHIYTTLEPTLFYKLKRIVNVEDYKDNVIATSFLTNALLDKAKKYFLEWAKPNKAIFNDINNLRPFIRAYIVKSVLWSIDNSPTLLNIYINHDDFETN